MTFKIYFNYTCFNVRNDFVNDTFHKNGLLDFSICRALNLEYEPYNFTQSPNWISKMTSARNRSRGVLNADKGCWKNASCLINGLTCEIIKPFYMGKTGQNFGVHIGQHKEIFFGTMKTLCGKAYEWKV